MMKVVVMVIDTDDDDDDDDDALMSTVTKGNIALQKRAHSQTSIVKMQISEK